MALKIRLRQQGRKNRLAYRLVVTDSRTRRDGKYVDMLGWYDPHLESGKDAAVYGEKIAEWLEKGAELSEKAAALIKRKAPDVAATLTAKLQARRAKLSKKRRKKTA